MVVMHIHADILPGKALELEQTARSLLPDLQREKGCLSYCFYQAINSQTKVCCLSEWQGKKNLLSHISSKLFIITSGAIHNLCENVFLNITSMQFTGTFNDLKTNPAVIDERRSSHG